MKHTIDILKSVEIRSIPTSSCSISEGGIAVGHNDGGVSIFNAKGELIASHSIEGKVVDLIFLEGVLIVGSSITGISIFPQTSEGFSLTSGCEFLSASGSHFLVVDGSGFLYRFDILGELLWKKEIGAITHISSNKTGSKSAIGLEDGRLMILDEFGNLLHDSPASDDDIETISCMLFRPDGTLVVARNSLGLVIDDRPENRIECWNMKSGLIHISETDSLVTSICSTSRGVILGCFNGELLDLEIGVSNQELLAEFDYPVTNLFIWNDDVLVASWFDIARVSFDKKVNWSLEHIGIVEHIIALDESRIAVLGDDKKNREPCPMYIINPDSEVKSTEFPFIEDLADSSSSEEFSGALSEDEERASSERPELPTDSSDIFDALDEELEIIVDEPVIEVDLLEHLSQSAKSLNLPPIVDVGEDQTITSNEEDTAIVLLDGSKSYDPDGFIKNWSWENEQGKVISEKSQVKVKLPKGVHVFYLTVFDNKDASSRATLTIQVV